MFTAGDTCLHVLPTIVVALDDFGFFPLGDLVFRFGVAADASDSGHAATELQGLRKPGSSNYFSAMNVNEPKVAD